MRRYVVFSLLLSSFSAFAEYPDPEPEPWKKDEAERRFAAGEKAYDTDGSITSLYHSALYYPSEISLRADGYIIGIEKSPRKAILEKGDLRIAPIPASELKPNEKETGREGLINDGKVMFISHIIENHSENMGADNCFLHNAYKLIDPVSGVAPPSLVRECVGSPANSGLPKALNGVANKSAFIESWTALDALKESINKRVKAKKYSHIVVITMGWNTIQEEAVRNFNSIALNLKKGADPEFNPLLIGVTWPSQWNSVWADPLWKLVSFNTKAEDADEVGLTWLGALLHKTIPDANTGLKVVVIGHSFGSRASSVAACYGPIIYKDTPITLEKNIDTLVNLQGAFRSSRLFGVEERNILFSDECKKTVENIALTASKHDTAVSRFDLISDHWVYSGSAKSYAKYCGSNSLIRCATAEADGKIKDSAGSSNITYISADALIREESYGSGGGAHSDIYRAEHGVLIRNIINRNYGGAAAATQ